MKHVIVNNGRNDSVIDIDAVEKKYNAKFVGQFCLKTIDGNWTNSVADVFWQETPPKEGYTHYFALIRQNSSTLITSGDSAIKDVLVGVISDGGEILYSRFRNDFRMSIDKTAYIDGGRDYVKCNRNTVRLKVIEDKFYLLEEGIDD